MHDMQANLYSYYQALYQTRWRAEVVKNIQAHLQLKPHSETEFVTFPTNPAI